jgi:N-acyl-D-aspartate/D-glutamate deacylase
LTPWNIADSDEPDHDPDYDLVLRGGKIIDGTGNPWFAGDVGVRNQRIVAVGRIAAGRGRRELNVQGLMVAPGFIDMHSHSDTLLLQDGNAQSKIRQGVTTEVLGEGRSMAPRVGKLSPRAIDIEGKVHQIESLEDYFQTVETAGIATNVASYVGLGTVWRCVMGDTFQRPTRDQLETMKQLVTQAIQHGAWGLSSQVMMPPGSLATTTEIIELCRAAAAQGGIYSTHIRNEGTGVFAAVEEAIRIAETAALPVDIIHLKIADQQFWGRMNELIALIEAARHRGVNVQANVYPYTRGNNNLSSIIPPWAHEGGRGAMLGRLRDPDTRQRMKRDILQGLPGWYNHFTAIGGDWSRMLVSGNNRFKGLTMDRVMALRTRGQERPDLLEELFDLLIEEGGSVGTVYAHHTERDMKLALHQPWCSIGSDGSAYAISGPLRRGHPHPRNFGTFPRVLGRYVREQQHLRLEDAIRKMTSLNANKLGLQQRGLLVPGYWADVTVFDAERVIDRATFTEPFQYNEGIEFVIVNGELVLNRGQHTGKRPGRALRKPPAPAP